MKALVVADLHLHHLPKWRFEWCVKFVEYVLSDFGCEYEGECDLFLLGDILEVRDHVDSRVLNLLLKLILRWRGGSVVWLSGQHDSYIPGKATLHNLDGTELVKGAVHVVDDEVFMFRNKDDYDYWFVPFQRRVEDYRRCLGEVPDGEKVLTHIPTKEIIEMYGGKDFDGVSEKEFKRFEWAISGDIHKFIDLECLSYVGAPSQRDWRDKGVAGKIGIIEGDEFSRIDVSHPKHIEVEEGDEVPDEGEYVVKFKRGVEVDLKDKNVLGVVEEAGVDIESVEFSFNGGEADEQIKEYIKKNKPDVGEVGEVEKMGREIVEDVL